MLNIKVEVSKNDIRRITRALERVKRSVNREREELPYRMAVDYVNLLRRNIMTQKFAGSYAPYNPRYAKWKEQYFATTGYWVMRGEIINNLTTYRDRGYKNRWIGGLPPSLSMVPSSSWFYPPGAGGQKPKSINMYAYVNEYGGNYSGYSHPARPIFRPTKVEYERGNFRRRGLEALQLIGRSWR